MTLHLPQPAVVLATLAGTLATAACAVAVLLYSGCFSTGDYLAPLLTAAVLGGAVAQLSTWRRLPLPAALAVSLALGVVVLMSVVLQPTWRHGLPTTETFDALREGVTGGWLRLLTTSPPVDPTPALLVFPAMMSWWCGWAAMHLAGRSRWVLAPVVPSLVAFVTGLAYGAPGLSSAAGVGTGWVCCVLTCVLLRTHAPAPSGSILTTMATALAERSRHAELRQLWLGVPTALLAIGIATVAGVLAPVQARGVRADPRNLVAQPFHISTSITPLATIQSQRARSDALFMVAASGAPIDRVRTAALDTFDGFTWSTSDTFVPAGHLLRGDHLVDGGDDVQVTVRVLGHPDSPLLPVVGEPYGLQASGLGYSRQGSLASTTPPQPGLAYKVSAVLQPPVSVPGDTPLASSAFVPSYLSLPTPPPALVAIASRIVAKATTPYEKAIVLAAYLRSLPFDANARAGESFGAITRMLSDVRAGDANGFAEQHASAFVVMARILDIPARVGVGYTLDTKALSAGQTVTVHTSDAHAWGEVAVAGYGWVPLETVNVTKAKVAASQDSSIAAPAGTSGVRGGTSAGPGSGDAEGGTAVQTVLRRAVTGGQVALGCAAAYILLVVGEKLRRRYWRRRAGASRQITGAWREAQDRLTERGVHPRPDWSARENARAAEERLGAPAAATLALASIADEAWYAPEPPSAPLAQAAWQLSRQLSRELAASRPLWARPLTLLDPRPLLPTRLRARRFGRRKRHPRPTADPRLAAAT